MNNPKTCILSNGLRYIIIPNNYIQSCSIIIYVKVGSRDETVKTSGISHFLEHMLFKGTVKRALPQDISTELDLLGADYNAYTTKEYTAYHAKITADKTDKILEIFSDMLFNSVLEKSKITQEKKVVLAELHKAIDDSSHYSMELLGNTIFNKHALNNSVIGYKNTIQKYTRDDVANYKYKYYVPSNMVISVSGKICKNIHELITKYFTITNITGNVENKWNINNKLLYKTITPIRQKTSVKRDISQSQICIGFPICGIHDNRMRVLLVLKTILGGNMSSRLFNVLRVQHNLVYNISADIELYSDLGLFVITGGIEHSKLYIALTLIKQELYRLCKEKITPIELENAIQYITGQYILDLEDSNSVAHYYGQQLLYNMPIMTYNQFLNNFKTITIDDVYNLANDLLDFNKICITVVGSIE